MGGSGSIIGGEVRRFVAEGALGVIRGEVAWREGVLGSVVVVVVGTIAGGEGVLLRGGDSDSEFVFCFAGEEGEDRLLTGRFGVVDAAYLIVWNAVLCIIPGSIKVRLSPAPRICREERGTHIAPRTIFEEIGERGEGLRRVDIYLAY